MNIFLAAIAVLLTAQGATPELSIQHDGGDTQLAGELITLTLTISLPAGYLDAEVSLQPLLLDNFQRKQIEMAARQIGAGESARSSRTFVVGLEPLEPGNATVSDIIVQVFRQGEPPINVTAPGFTISILQPIQWDTLFFWILLVTVATAIIIVAAIIYSRRNSDRSGKKSTREGEERRSRIRQIDVLIRTNEWGGAVEQSFSSIITEVDKQDAGKGDLIVKSRGFIDLTAAYRLGEEVRYGGYQPVRREAIFMRNTLREIYQKQVFRDNR